MKQSRYFQVSGFSYVNNLIRVRKLGVVFQFFVIPDGDNTSVFIIKVIFSLLLLNTMGKQFVLGSRPFLREQDKPEYLRYAFYRLKCQLEKSNLTNRNDITIDHTEAGLLKNGLPKQCDFLVPYGNSLFCFGDASKPIETSPQLCEKCLLPEPLFRCNNLRIQKVDSSTDSENKWQIIPSCYCIDGNKIPSELKQCWGYDCFVPFKFYLQPQKPPLGFKT